MWTHDSLTAWSIHLGLGIRAESRLRIYPNKLRLADSLLWSFSLSFLRDKVLRIKTDFTGIFLYFDRWNSLKNGLSDCFQASCSVLESRPRPGTAEFTVSV